jgi:hypothetical protein
MAKYDDSYKTKALLLLKRYDFNKSRVCKELGIRYETITSWQNSKLGKKVLKEKDIQAPQTGTGITKEIKSEVDKVVEKSIIEFKKKELTLDQLIFETKEVILNRIKQITPGIKNAYALAALLTAMKDFDAVKETPQQNNTLFQQFINEQFIVNENNNPNH